MHRALMLALAGAAVAGCSAQPGPPGSEVRVVVMRGLTAAEHARNEQWSSEAERRRDAATGLRDLAGQGRVLVTRCAVSRFEVVFHEAVLPAGAAVPPEGALLRVRLGDAATPDLVLGPVTDPPGLVHGRVALGAPADALLARHYYPIRGFHVLACTPRG